MAEDISKILSLIISILLMVPAFVVLCVAIFYLLRCQEPQQIIDKMEEGSICEDTATLKGSLNEFPVIGDEPRIVQLNIST
jgi:uncharacterized protein YpmS